MDNEEQKVRTRTLNWDEIVKKSWGKDWTKPDPAYEFSGNRTFDDPKVGGPYTPEE